MQVSAMRFLISLKAEGLIEPHCADTVIWSICRIPVEDQAIGRAHEWDRKQNAEVYRMIIVVRLKKKSKNRKLPKATLGLNDFRGTIRRNGFKLNILAWNKPIPMSAERESMTEKKYFPQVGDNAGWC